MAPAAACFSFSSAYLPTPGPLLSAALGSSRGNFPAVAAGLCGAVLPRERGVPGL